MFEIGLVLLIILQLIIMVRYYCSCSKKFAKFCFGFASGIISLYPAIYIISYLGGNISINIFTITVASILGIPGTFLLAIASVL